MTIQRRISKMFISSILMLSSMFAFGALIAAPSVYAATDAKQAVCEGAASVDGSGTSCSATGSDTLQKVLSTGLNLFSAIIGIIAVVMIMVAGLKYITSQGEAANIASAKNTIIYAAIGLVVVALAQVIVRFVLNKFTA